MNFFLQIYYGIINLFSSPSRMAQSMHEAPPHRRAFVLGIPSAIIGLFVVATTLWAQFGSKEPLIKKYEVAAERSREKAAESVAMLDLRQRMGEKAKLPESYAKRIRKDFHEMSVKQLQEEKNKALDEWKLYLYKLIDLDDSQDEYKLKLAEAANQKGDIKLVRSLLTQLAPLDRPGNKDAQYSMGINFARRQLYQRAAQHFRNALQSDSEYHRARIQLIEVLIKTEEYSLAKDELDTIFETQLVHYPVLLSQARLINLKLEGEIGERKTLHQAVSILGEYVETNEKEGRKYWPYLLQCYVALENFEAAERLVTRLQSTATSEREKTDFKMRLSALYSAWARALGPTGERRDPEKRVYYLRESFKRNPENPGALRQIAYMALLESDPAIRAKARELYDPLKDTNPTAGVHIELSNYFLALSRSYANQNKTAESVQARNRAVVELEKAHEKNPTDIQVANNLAYLLIQQGEDEIDKALRMAEYATRSMAQLKKTSEISEFYDTLGHVQMAKAIALARSDNVKSQDYFLEACTSLNRARVGRPRNLQILNSLAICKRNVGDTETAKMLEKKIAEIKRQQGLDN